MITRVKFCGMTRAEDVLLAADLGAHAIGLIFYKHSSRAVTFHQAQKILEKLPPFMAVVGVFVNASTEEIKTILNRVPLTTLQFHGDETPEFCQQFNRPYIKVLRVGKDDLDSETRQHIHAQAFLLDTFKAHTPGGTGELFDWQYVPRNATKPLILAGGLSPENITEALQQVRPYGVDVVSGIEQSPGIKDPIKMQRFMQAVIRCTRYIKM